MTNFFTFYQNNSGGSFITNDKVCEFVIIEANDAPHANIIAESLGIYFNGCDEGYDCECCGDRWSECWKLDGNETPSIYGDPPEKYKSGFCGVDEVYCRVYYMNGTVKEFVNS